MKLRADKAGKIGFALYMDIIQDRYEVDVSDNTYTVSGFVDGGDHKFQVQIKAIPYGGSDFGGKSMGITKPFLGIQDADSVVLILNVSTDYKQQWPDITILW